MDPACIGRKENINMITFKNMEFSNKKVGNMASYISITKM
jgi:hypothetical protein